MERLKRIVPVIIPIIVFIAMYYGVSILVESSKEISYWSYSTKVWFFVSVFVISVILRLILYKCWR